MRSVSRCLVPAAFLVLLSACGGKQEGEAAGASAAAEEKTCRHLQLVGLHRRHDDRGLRGEDRHQGHLRRLDSNEVLETKLLAGRTGYDIVVPTAPFLERQIKAGVFLKLDKSKLPNLANMDPEIMKRTARHDPGNEHSITYLWGTIGLGYNVDMVKKALGTDTIDSWSAIFEPKNAAKLAKCGITILDAPTDVFGSVAIYKGLDPNSEKPEDLAVVEETLTKIRPYVKIFPLVVLYQRSGRRRNLRGARLERRRAAGARPRRGRRRNR